MTHVHWLFIGVGESTIDSQSVSGICSLRLPYLYLQIVQLHSPKFQRARALISLLLLQLKPLCQTRRACKLSNFPRHMTKLSLLPKQTLLDYSAYMTTAPFPSMILRIRAGMPHLWYLNRKSKSLPGFLSSLIMATHSIRILTRIHGLLATGIGIMASRSPRRASTPSSRSLAVQTSAPRTCATLIGLRSTVILVVHRFAQPLEHPQAQVMGSSRTCNIGCPRRTVGCREALQSLCPFLNGRYTPVRGITPSPTFTVDLFFQSSATNSQILFAVGPFGSCYN